MCGREGYESVWLYERHVPSGDIGSQTIDFVPVHGLQATSRPAYSRSVKDEAEMQTINILEAIDPLFVQSMTSLPCTLAVRLYSLYIWLSRA